MDFPKHQSSEHLLSFWESGDWNEKMTISMYFAFELTKCQLPFSMLYCIDIPVSPSTSPRSVNSNSETMYFTYKRRRWKNSHPRPNPNSFKNNSTMWAATLYQTLISGNNTSSDTMSKPVDRSTTSTQLSISWTLQNPFSTTRAAKEDVKECERSQCCHINICSFRQSTTLHFR